MKSVAAAALALTGIAFALGLAGRSPATDSPPPREVLELRVWQPPADIDLTGKWLLTLPAGFTHEVTFTSIGHERLRLQPNHLNCAGVYLVRDGELMLEEALDRRDQGYSWKFLNANVLVLTSEPGNRGAHYVGATLSRNPAPPPPAGP